MKKVTISCLCLLLVTIAYAQTDIPQDVVENELPPQMPEEILPPVKEEIDIKGKIPTIKINIDGNADDWTTVPVFIQDTEGDVRTQYVGEDVCEFDVKDIKLARDNSYLLMLIVFARELSYYFNTNGKRSKAIGTIFLDIDNEQNSGGKEFFSKLGGFESKIDIWSGVKVKGGSSVAGNAFLTDIPQGAALEYFVQYIPSKYDVDRDSLDTDFSKVVKSDEKPTLIKYSKDFIELKIPFVDLNIQPENHKTFRALFSEFGSGSWGFGKDTFSEEATGTID